jgi:hypothetical protein
MYLEGVVRTTSGGVVQLKKISCHVNTQCHTQGVQMFFCEKLPQMWPHTYFVKFITQVFPLKSSSKTKGIYIIFKLPKPKCENSPNLGYEQQSGTNVMLMLQPFT